MPSNEFVSVHVGLAWFNCMHVCAHFFCMFQDMLEEKCYEVGEAQEPHNDNHGVLFFVFLSKNADIIFSNHLAHDKRTLFRDVVYTRTVFSLLR